MSFILSYLHNLLQSKKKIIYLCLLFCLFLIIEINPLSTKTKQPLYNKTLSEIQNGNENILKNITYNEVLELSAFVRHLAQKEELSLMSILWNANKKRYQRKVASAFLGGLLNKDPKVRLFSSRILLKLGIRRDWIELTVQRVLDPIGETKETVDNYYYYEDIYGYMQKENIKYALPRLLELSSQIILLSPKENSMIFKNKGLLLEWSAMYEAKNYELYIEDILYYAGEDTFAHIKTTLPFGTTKWMVIAKDTYDRYITKAEGIFHIASPNNKAGYKTDERKQNTINTKQDRNDEELDFDISDFK